MSASSVSFTSGTPETVLPPVAAEIQSALDAAAARPAEQRRDAYAQIAWSSPRCLEAWAGMAEATAEQIERYAYARVGYHRGLDSLRAAGWRGSGHVRWAHPSNRGFLRCLDELRAAAGTIGESDEQERCALFLRQLDPDWPPPERRLA
jgi:hypothetical protein